MSETALPFSSDGPLTPAVYARLLRDIHRHRLDGQLIVSELAASKKIFCSNGYISYANSNVESDRLGDLLLANGLITKAQYDESVVQLKTSGKKQGTVLVQMGAISPKDLFRGLINQINHISQSPFFFSKGHYQFRTNVNTEEEILVLKINPGAVIHDALTRLPLGDGNIEASSGVAFLPRDESAFDPDDLPLSPLEKKILSAASGKKTLSEIAAFTASPLATVVRSYLILQELGFLDADRTTATPGAQPEEPTAASTAAAPAIDSELRHEVILFHQRLPKLSLYGILDLPDNCGDQDIKRAYIKRAKEYHPDRFYRPQLEDLAPMANEIFMKINEAYTILSDSQRRRQYHESVLGGMDRSGEAKGGNDRAMAQEQFKKGMALLKAKQAAEAVEAFRWAARLNPDNPLFHSYLALALMETGRRLKEAEEHLKTAITLDYNNPQYYINLGLVYKKGKAFDQAAQTFKRALKLDPKNETALSELKQLPAIKDTPEDRSSFLGKILGR